MSLGGEEGHPLVEEAVQYAESKGVLLVAAAGNDGPDEGSIDYPGAYPGVVVVGAINEGREVVVWSSRGVNNNDGLIGALEVEFAAPGVNVLSTYKDGCYALMSGTSMAAPHVSGQAARLWQGSGQATRAFLQSIAQNLSTPGEDSATGLGLPVQ